MSRFAKVSEPDHPVFKGRNGRTTLALYVQLAMAAQTNPKGIKPERPLGHVRGGEETYAAKLDVGTQTVRRHFGRLSDAGLIVEWKPPVRGQVYLRPDGTWGGLVREYLVVAFADEAGLEMAGLRAQQREFTRRRRAMRPHGQRVRDPATGRWVSSTSDHTSTGHAATAQPMVQPSLPIVAGVPALRDQEERDQEERDHGTPRVRSGDRTQQARSRAKPWNHTAYRLLRDVEDHGVMPSPPLDGVRVGAANVITVWLQLTGRDVPEWEVVEYLRLAADLMREEKAEYHEAIGEAFNIAPTDYADWAGWPS